jgi:chemosensory pili system protein ChpA (sensor histidine kinase/response regulator)
MNALLRSSALEIVERRSISTNALVVASDPSSESDLRPLSWVRHEIDEALAQAIESLATFSKPERDAAALKAARKHVHQAAGAVRMVGLDAGAEFATEIERVIGGLEGTDSARVESACAVVERACRKLSIFLGEVASGAPPATLKLYPEYVTMRRTRGGEPAAPSDLYYPNLRVRAPKTLLREAIPEGKLQSHLAKKRRLYQSGLLLWLRGDASGTRTMRDAVAGLEAVAEQENVRAFWWTVRALLEALDERGLDCTPEVKQLAARIDLQIRRILEGSIAVADRLRREVLYCVAKSSPAGPTVHAVQRAFHLLSLIPPADAVDADFASIEPRLREGRKQLSSIKDTWLNFASGRSENLPKLKQALMVVHGQATELRHAALTELTAALLERLNAMPAGAVAESLAMEFTTALLLTESAFENYANLSTEFPQQVRAMLARLEATASGRPALGDATMLGNLGKRAQERMILSQVGHEIRANLHRMEDVLDEFLRDEAKRPTLASIARESHQIHGALRILGLDVADRLLTRCDERIQTYSNSDANISSDELDLLAESLCGLEFYFEAVEQQRGGAEGLIAPLLARWGGETLAEATDEEASVEAAVAALRAELPRLVEAVHADRNDPKTVEDLKTKLTHLKDDAALIGDEQLALQASVAIAELDRGGHDLAGAVQAIAGSSPRIPEIAEETQRLLGVDATRRAAGTLEIYLTEAGTVLGTIGDALGSLIRNAEDRPALETVRLGFHTLKESGCMVGMTDLAELAGEVDAICKRLLEGRRPVTPTALAMIDTARASFSDWFNALRHKGGVQPNGAKLRALLSAVERELSSTIGPVALAPTIASSKAPAKLTDSEAESTPENPTAPTVPSFDPESKNTRVGLTEPPRIDASKLSSKQDIWSIALVQPTSSETLAGIRDEIDADLLAGFLKEASALLPSAREELRAWGKAPSNRAAAEQLHRTLHAFKGGARMAGAMRLGRLLESMESRLVSREQRTAPPEFFQALNTDLDFIGYMLDRLTTGESDVVLPRVVTKSVAPAVPAAPTRPVDAPAKAARGECSTAVPAAPAGGVAVLRVNLDELARRMGGLRQQIRDIESQTELTLRSRMTELYDGRGDCDSGELNTLTRVQDLTQSISEVLNELMGVEESLLQHLDDPANGSRATAGSGACHMAADLHYQPA